MYHGVPNRRRLRAVFLPGGGLLLVGFDDLTAAILSTAIFAPFIEEFSKIFPLYYRHGETQRSIFNQFVTTVGQLGLYWLVLNEAPPR